jgi:hypothetical protein
MHPALVDTGNWWLPVKANHWHYTDDGRISFHDEDNQEIACVAAGTWVFVEDNRGPTVLEVLAEDITRSVVANALGFVVFGADGREVSIRDGVDSIELTGEEIAICQRAADNVLDHLTKRLRLRLTRVEVSRV